MSLKKRLVAYMKEDWRFPANIEADGLADEMKEAIGNPDGVLRDRLVLSGFCRLIASGRISDKKCRMLFDELVSDKYLLNGLGTECDDSVFGRAFSGYVIVELLNYNEEKKGEVFAKEDTLHAFWAVLKCFSDEKDLRGFVDGKGWAHSIAHNADCLAAFAGDGALEHDELMAILKAIKIRVHQCQGEIISEYGRILEPVLSVLGRKIISEQNFLDWLTDTCFYERTGNPDEDARNIMARLEFAINLRSKLRENYPNLISYVLDETMTLIAM